MVDPGESPADAAVRELREETGYAGGTPRLLGVVDPNPAIQTNLCHLFWIDGCRRVGEQRPDDGEDIEVLTMTPAEARAAVKDGRIRHALVVCALSRLPDGI
jgi:8-oxo-dGTP pyrophosphatase MutT (NUDIX family)